jgi:hypothetical protein
MSEFNPEDYNVYNWREAGKYVSAVSDPAIKRLLEYNLGTLMMATFPPANRNAKPVRGFDALLFVQLNHKLFRYKEEVIQTFQGDLSVLDDAW